MEDHNGLGYEILEKEAAEEGPAKPAGSPNGYAKTGSFRVGSFTAGETGQGAVEHNDLVGQRGLPAALLKQRGTRAIRGDGGEFMTEPVTSSPVIEPIAEHQYSSSETGHELESFSGATFESKPLWTDLYENIRDVFFPQKLPPLELTSKPIAVIDPMAVKTNPWSVGSAAVINGGILALLLYFGARQVIQKIVPPKVDVTPVDITPFKLNAPKKAVEAGGGGGGGSHDIVDPIKGKLPPREKNPELPPQVAVVEKPKLALDAAINVQKDIKLPDNPNMPNFGVKNSANVTLASNGQGSGGGMGTGHGGGIGSGSGNGYGPGSGGNTGGGVERIGGGVSAPVPIFEPEAEFSDEARRAKYQGEVMVSLIVDAQGNPQNPRVVRPLGMGLDEKALEAVMKYKFKPAMKGGHAVPVYLTIAVNFRLY
jgi:TonB family protein